MCVEGRNMRISRIRKKKTIVSGAKCIILMIGTRKGGYEIGLVVSLSSVLSFVFYS